MKVVVLCGGEGTRIRSVDENLPKPMIPIGPYPILWHIMKNYAQWGHSEFVLCLGYRAQAIKEFFLNYDAYTNDITLTIGRDKSIEHHGNHNETGWRITLAETGQKAMTGARVRKIRKYIGDDETFMLTYGDGLSDVDVDKLLAFHKSHGKVLTVTGVRPMGRFGELECDASGMVTEFNEKPQATAGRISGGFFVCNRRLFDYLDDGDDLVFEQTPMKRLVADGELMVYEHDAFWQCMDTYRDFQYLTDLWRTERAPWMNWA